MLSEASYMTAIYAYVGAACAILLIFALWLGRRWRPAWATLVVLLLAALLLTPAYPKDGVDTMAPALIVAAFQLLTYGYEAALHALRPLGFMSALAVGLTVLLRLTIFRRRRANPAPAGEAQQPG